VKVGGCLIGFACLFTVAAHALSVVTGGTFSLGGYESYIGLAGVALMMLAFAS
jgi:hypothetical protein